MAGGPVARALGGSRRQRIQNPAGRPRRGKASRRCRSPPHERPSGGRPDVVKDRIFKQIKIFINQNIKNPSAQIRSLTLRNAILRLKQWQDVAVASLVLRRERVCRRLPAKVLLGSTMSGCRAGGSLQRNVAHVLRWLSPSKDRM